jgi:hypothetical protein
MLCPLSNRRFVPMGDIRHLVCWPRIVASTGQGLSKSLPVSIPEFGRDLVKTFRRLGGAKRFVPLDEAIFPVREDRLKSMPDNDFEHQMTSPEKHRTAHTENRRTAMKRPLLMFAFLTLACAATLAPIRSTPPILLSDADGAGWKCSRSAVILTTCAPNRDVRLTSVN